MNRIDEGFEFLYKKYRKARINEAHPIRVFKILKKKFEVTDEDILLAGLLHDILEDTETSTEELEESFGEKVKGLVLELTHKKFDEGKPTAKDYEKHHKNIKTISDDAKTIKLADEFSKYEVMISPLKWFNKKRLNDDTNPSTEVSMRNFIKESKGITGQDKLNDLVVEFDDLLSVASEEVKNIK